jgi:hypothetical protein
VISNVFVSLKPLLIEYIIRVSFSDRHSFSRFFYIKQVILFCISQSIMVCYCSTGMLFYSFPLAFLSLHSPLTVHIIYENHIFSPLSMSLIYPIWRPYGYPWRVYESNMKIVVNYCFFECARQRKDYWININYLFEC